MLPHSSAEIKKQNFITTVNHLSQLNYYHIARRLFNKIKILKKQQKINETKTEEEKNQKHKYLILQPGFW